MNKRDLLGWLLYITCRPAIKMPELLSLYFHNPTPKSFERTIKWVLNQGYEFQRIEEVRLYLSGSKALNKKVALLTFDDAWKGNLELIPIIEKYNIPITIFAPIEPLISGNYWWEYVQAKGGRALSTEFKSYDEARFVEECAKIKKEISLQRSAMTMDELKKISTHPLVEIGSHSYSHPILTHISDEHLEYELRESKKYIEELIGKDIHYFCYPNGSFAKREIDFTRKYYQCAFSTIQDKPKVGGDLFTIPRYAMTNDYWSNLAKLIGIWHKVVKK